MVTDRETALTEAKELAEALKGIEAGIEGDTLIVFHRGTKVKGELKVEGAEVSREVITKGRELALTVRAVASKVSLIRDADRAARIYFGWREEKGRGYTVRVPFIKAVEGDGYEVAKEGESFEVCVDAEGREGEVVRVLENARLVVKILS